MELSGEFPVQLLCGTMEIQRSSFYHWKKRLSNPAPKTKALADNIILFQKYHIKYPPHGCRWLNAKIKLDTGLHVSDPYAHKCCKLAGIKSKSKHYRYKKPGELRKVYPNLVLAGINIDGPMQCIVSDMTAFLVKGIYYELTLYMDLWNNEILSHSLSAKQGISAVLPIYSRLIIICTCPFDAIRFLFWFAFLSSPIFNSSFP